MTSRQTIGRGERDDDGAVGKVKIYFYLNHVTFNNVTEQ